MAAALVALLGIVVVARLADAAIAPAPAAVVAMTARRFEYAPETIVAKVGVPLVL